MAMLLWNTVRRGGAMRRRKCRPTVVLDTYSQPQVVLPRARRLALTRNECMASCVTPYAFTGRSVHASQARGPSLRQYYINICAQTEQYYANVVMSVLFLNTAQYSDIHLL